MKRLVFALAILLVSVRPASAQFAYQFGPQQYCYSLNWSWNSPYASESYSYGMRIGPACSACNGCGYGCGTFAYGPKDWLWTTDGVDHYRYSAYSTVVGTRTAMITMAVPANAEVLVQGQPTKQTGAVRSFVTPPLDGPTTYQVKVRWKDGRKDNEQLLAVNVKPGDSPTVRILR